MRFVFEDVGQVEDGVERLEGFEFGGVAFGEGEAAALYELNGFALCAELGVGVDAVYSFTLSAKACIALWTGMSLLWLWLSLRVTAACAPSARVATAAASSAFLRFFM